MGRRTPKPPVKMKRLTLDIPEPLHRVIKIAAAQEGVGLGVDLSRAAVVGERRQVEGGAKQVGGISGQRP